LRCEAHFAATVAAGTHECPQKSQMIILTIHRLSLDMQAVGRTLICKKIVQPIVVPAQAPNPCKQLGRT
jgi:hypothetical protein